MVKEPHLTCLFLEVQAILLLEPCSKKLLYLVLKDLSQTSFLCLQGEFFFESLSSKQRWNKQFPKHISSCQCCFYISNFHAIPFVRYDGHVLDPLANLQLTTGTYYMLASSIKQLAKDLCGGRCVFFLEGGYNLKSLSYSVADTFRALLGDKSLASEFDNPNILYEEPTKRVKQAIQRIKHLHSL